MESELTRLREAIRDHSLYEAKHVLLKARCSFYEYGLLANALRTKRSKTYVPALLSSSGSKVHSSPELAESFREFYSKLYNLDQPPTSDLLPQSPLDICNYLRESNLLTLTTEEREDLSKPITVEELTSAIATTQPGKAPGPDGLTLPYYKQHQDSLAPHFITAFNAVLEGHVFPADMQHASITVIPKPGIMC